MAVDKTHAALWWTLAGLALAKLGFLVALGPVYLPDSDDYVLFADAILQGGDWMHSLDLKAEEIPLTAFRGIGYPALIALYKVLFGDVWDWALVASQFALSLAATAALWRLAWRLSGRIWVAVAAALAQGLGLAFVLDQCVLTDGPHAALLIVIAATMATALLDGRPATPARALGLGALLLAAFLLREAGAVTHIALWPLAIAWALSAGRGLRRAVPVFIAFLAPLVLGVQGYKTWNQVRTGERFITTVGQTAMYHPVLDLARKGHPVFAQDPLLADARDLLPLDPIPGVTFRRIIRHLSRQHDMNALEIARHADALFYDHWRRYPKARAEIYLGRLDWRYAYLPVMPLSAPERLSLWAGGGTPFPPPGELRRNLVEHGRVDQVVLVGLRTLARLISFALTAAFLIGVPVLIVRALAQAHWRPAGLDRRQVVFGALWLFVAAYPAAYALVYLEDRYLAPVVPFVALIGLSLLAPWAEKGMRGLTAHFGRSTG